MGAGIIGSIYGEHEAGEVYRNIGRFPIQRLLAFDRSEQPETTRREGERRNGVCGAFRDYQIEHEGEELTMLSRSTPFFTLVHATSAPKGYRTAATATIILVKSRDFGEGVVVFSALCWLELPQKPNASSHPNSPKQI